MKILADLHHAGLADSLRRLFEERLGYEIYFPIGEKWFEEGYWKIAEPYGNAPDTINQFLGFDQSGIHESMRLNEENNAVSEGIYQVKDKFHNKWLKKITFERFLKEDFDIVISTYMPHDQAYADMIKKYHLNAKLISQVGNEGQVPQWDVINNVLASVIPGAFEVPGDKNVVFYHQEFDQKIFQYHAPVFSKTIISVMNGPMEQHDREVFEALKKRLPEFKFKVYGASGEDGPIDSIEELRDKMIEADLIWHTKPHDGFGHIIHNAYALGRPVITRGSYYRGKLGGLLLNYDNFIDLESPLDLADRIENKYRMGVGLGNLSVNARNTFRKQVDYDIEIKSIKQFIKDLK